MTIHVHKGDLPATLTFSDTIAVDCEMMGLNFFRDRLCLVQISDGDGNAHLVQIEQGQASAPHLQAVLENPNITKIFHFARMDIVSLNVWLGIECAPVYCTKIASRLVRTFTDKHGFKYLMKELLNIDISKQEQSSDWGAETLSPEQREYAAGDVIYLHRIKAILDEMLEREGRTEMAHACFDFLPIRAALDISGWDDTDIFAH